MIIHYHIAPLMRHMIFYQLDPGILLSKIYLKDALGSSDMWKLNYSPNRKSVVWYSQWHNHGKGHKSVFEQKLWT